MPAEPPITDRERAIDAAHELISSRRVEGTAVYNREDEKLGTIHSVMIDKRSGQAAYALMSFGGFLGMVERVHPIPWEMLSYDVGRDAYVLDLTRDQLENAPTMALDHADRPRDLSREQVASYYVVPFGGWGL